jgi:hypothetical protein
MLLVVGLAIAGVVGIAAAFYFSIRSGSGGDKRLRSVGAGRAGTDRRPRSRSGDTARPDRTDNARRAANGRRPANTGPAANTPPRNYQAEASTGPNPVLDFGDPAFAGGRGGGLDTPVGDPQATDPRLIAAGPDESRLSESRLGGSQPDEARPSQSRPGSRSAARLSREAHATGGTGRPRRRVGFRKGADVDEELWPTESFGGVSDEQFWDDLASDKPLTTTARTAQQDPGTRNRPLKAVPSPAATPAAAAPPAATPPAATQPVRNMAPQVPGATQPVRNMAPQVPGATQPVRNMAPQVPGVTEPVRATTGPSPLTSTSSQPPGASQPPSAAARPAETRERRRARRSDEEDPLTSAAFSLRTSGPVDGRSSRRSRDMTREPHDASVAQETQTFSAAETEAASGGYPGGVPPFRQSESSAGSRSPSSYPGAAHGDPSSVTQAMSTPPYGENYGYGGGSSPVLPEEPRRPNGTRSHARHGGTGEVTRASRQAYPQDSSQATRGYPSSDGYPGTGSYPGDGYPAGGYPTGGYLAAGQQGNGHQAGSYPGGTQPSSAHQSGAYPGGSHQGNANAYRGNSHRAPYDPRDDYRRSTHLG